MNKKLIAAGLALLLLAGGGYYAYTSYQQKQAAEQAAAVKTVKVERMNIKSTVSATGTIRPVDSVEVSAKITARIKSILVKESGYPGRQGF